MRSHGYNVTPNSYLAYHLYDFHPNGRHYSIKTRLSDYCRLKNISKFQVFTLVRKKWVAIAKHRGEIWVEELCPDEIQNHFF